MRTFHLPNTRCLHGFRLNDSRQNRVGAAAFLIHLSRADVSVPGAAGYQIEHVLNIANRLFNQSININASFDVFANMEVLRARVQEIHNHLIVNFKVRRFYEVFDLTTVVFRFCFFSLNSLKNVFKAALH